MKCQTCHQTVARKSRYCANCGAPVVPRSSQRQPAEKSKPLTTGYAAALVGAGVLVGFLIFKFGISNSGSEDNADIPAALQSAEVLDVAQGFMCPCGKCSDRLDVCTCDHPKGAFEVKGFIAQQLAVGHMKPHIVEMVQKKYGGHIHNNNAPLKLDFQLPGKSNSN
jgi:hypothetical protein